MLSWWKAFLDILYPPRCPACKGEVATHGRWCHHCLRHVLSVRELNCADHHLKHLDGCLAVCEYTGSVKRLIHAMKFQRKKKYALPLRRLLEEGRIARRLFEVNLVLPVPLSAQRLRERGYNQVEAVFAKWAKTEKLPWEPQLLLRSKNTLPQWTLTVPERRKNIKDAFFLTRPEKVKNKTILLVDDIVTTGVTLEECARVLKQAGAIQVYALTIAAGADR